MRAIYPKTGIAVKILDLFILKPSDRRREALSEEQRETERQGLAVDAQMRLLESEEEKANSHWRLLKKTPRRP